MCTIFKEEEIPYARFTYFKLKYLYDEKIIEENIIEFIQKLISSEQDHECHKKKVNIPLKWSPIRHINIVSKLAKIEQKYDAQIQLNCEYEIKDSIYNTVSETLSKSDIKFIIEFNGQIPDEVKIWISNFKNQIDQTKRNKLELNDIIFDCKNRGEDSATKKSYELFIFIEKGDSYNASESGESKSIIG